MIMKNLNLLVVLSVLIFTNVANAEDKKDSKSGPTSPSDVMMVSAPVGIAGIAGSFKLGDAALSYGGDLHVREQIRSDRLFDRNSHNVSADESNKKIHDMIANLKQNPLKKGEYIEIDYKSAAGNLVKGTFKHSDSLKTLEELLTRNGANNIKKVTFHSADRWKLKALNGATIGSAAVGSVASFITVVMGLVPEQRVSEYRDSYRNPQSTQASTKAVASSAPATSAEAAEAKASTAHEAD